MAPKTQKVASFAELQANPEIETSLQTRTFNLHGLEPWINGDKITVTMQVTKFNGTILTEGYGDYLHHLGIPEEFVMEQLERMQRNIAAYQMAMVLVDRLED